ncbi:hypothetical protein MTO96_052320 [Rhipicephalus appendiculatus]
MCTTEQNVLRRDSPPHSMFPASEYFRSLSAADQQRYSGKLLVYGVQCPDPYGIPDSEWVHDAAAKRLCPPVKMTNVVIYLLFSPSQFTPENVENYKSLQAYNYFQSGLVRKCRIWRSNAKKICIVRAEVMPSQTASARGHDVWLCVDRSSGQATMAPLDEINLNRPGKKARKLSTKANYTSQPFNPSDKHIFERLRRVNASAVVLRSIPKLDPEETDSASEDEEMFTFLRLPSSVQLPMDCGIAAAMVLGFWKLNVHGLSGSLIIKLWKPLM